MDRLAILVAVILILNGITLPVVQQTSPDYISNDQEITQFDLAAQYGTTGMLAHNTLAGENFLHIDYGQVISVVYEDGHREDFIVTDIQVFQAVDPTSIRTPLINLETGRTWSASRTFRHFYTGHHLTLQTCFAQDGNGAWGRVFIVAVPMNGE